VRILDRLKFSISTVKGWSQWPLGQRRGSAAARFLGLWFESRLLHGYLSF